jgi:hypothetical protein
MDTQDMVAAFLAKGGKVTKIEEGKRAIADEGAIYRAMQEGEKIAADDVRAARASEDRHEREQEAFSAARFDGWNVADAHEYSQTAR